MLTKRLGHVRLTTTMVYLHGADMEPHSLTWHSAGPVPLAGMSRCVPSAGICISAITAVVTDIITIPQGIRKQGVMTMDIDAFLNLLSLHILPSHFVRIRHYGFLSPCNREILRSIQQQLNVPPVPKDRKKKSFLEICDEKGWNIGFCEACCCQRIIMRIIKPVPRAPPFVFWHLKD